MRNFKDDNKVILLKRDARKWMWTWLCAALFLIGTQLLGTDMKFGVWGYWASTAFWSVGILIATVQLIPGSSSLKLDRAGITITKLFKKRFVSWDDCSEFKVCTYGYAGYWPLTMKLNGVVFSSGLSGWLAEMSKKRTGEDDGLSGTYGLSAEELCSLLNEWRRILRGAS
ncbi:MAG: hypothetical protein GY948_06880 [Alphaproteobacteria bacterium]|nr:hypothetical protein [Alphaproteobacteria bacterium]